MKLKFLVMGCLSILLMSSAMAEEDIINEEEFSDFSALELAQNDAQSIEGTSAGGEAQTTIVDENGNLKIIEKKPKPDTSTQAKNDADQSETSPGMTQTAPTPPAAPVTPGQQPQMQAPSAQPQTPPMPAPSAPVPNQGDMTPPKPTNPAPQGQGANQPLNPTGSEIPAGQPQQMQMPEPRSTDMPNG